MKDIAHQNYIGEQICKLRKSKGWTQYTLGKKLCKKTSTISAYETNAKLPSAECLIEMAELFGASLLEAGVDIRYIQSMLGHSSIATTQIYTHVTTQKQTLLLAERHPRSKMSFSI